MHLMQLNIDVVQQSLSVDGSTRTRYGNEDPQLEGPSRRPQMQLMRPEYGGKRTFGKRVRSGSPLSPPVLRHDILS